MYQQTNTMKRFNKTYYTENFRVRLQISNTSDRLTIYKTFGNNIGQRIVYEMYFKRDNLSNRILKDLMSVNVPFKTIEDVMTDVKLNLV